MMMGRPSSVPELRRALITALVRTRARRWLALMFTMRGLDSWPL